MTLWLNFTFLFKKYNHNKSSPERSVCSYTRIIILHSLLSRHNLPIRNLFVRPRYIITVPTRAIYMLSNILMLQYVLLCRLPFVISYCNRTWQIYQWVLPKPSTQFHKVISQNETLFCQYDSHFIDVYGYRFSRLYQWYDVVMGPEGTNFSEISVVIHTPFFEGNALEMASSKCHTYYQGFGVLEKMLLTKTICLSVTANN